MLFFFKRKKVVVDAYTAAPLLTTMAPIEPTRKFLPDWWKQLPKTVTVKQKDNPIPSTRATLKTCDGFLAYNKTGFIIPMWTDMKIVTRKNGMWTYTTPSASPCPVVDHPANQYGDHFKDFLNLKLIAPWTLEEKSGVQFYWTGAQYHLPPDMWGKINVMSATVNFKYQASANVPIFFPKEDAEYFIHHGTPLVHLVPLTEKEVEIRMHQVSPDEFIAKSNGRTFDRTFLGAYKKHKKRVDFLESQPKCPFGFGK